MLSSGLYFGLCLHVCSEVLLARIVSQEIDTTSVENWTEYCSWCSLSQNACGGRLDSVISCASPMLCAYSPQLGEIL